MRRISIIGGGQASLFLGIGLVDSGYDVTLYSDRTADDCLNSVKPPGNAIIQQGTIALEREYGISFWEDAAPDVNGVEFNLAPGNEDVARYMAGSVPAPKAGKIAINARASFPGPAQGYDLRMKNSRRMHEFEAHGGKIEIVRVDLDGLEDIAASSDLTVVAAGKWSVLGKIFEWDGERSDYDKPQRYLYMPIFRTSYKTDNLMRFEFNPPHGEYFYTPYLHKSGEQCMTGLFEAVAGGPLDVFRDIGDDGQLGLERVKAYVKEYTPWAYHVYADAELMDDLAWLAGAFPPCVNKPVGRLPSGRAVTPLGDTAIAFDPVGGFGGNNGERMAHLMIRRIKEHGDRPFDEAWMTDVFDEHWETFARPACRFNNMLLEPAPPHVLELLQAAARNRALADHIFAGINSPLTSDEWIADPEGARALMSRFVEERQSA